MNPYLSELIENYYALTGKPVASMTVTEYLQFASTASVMNPVPRQVTEIPSQIPEHKEISRVQEITPAVRQPEKKPDIKPAVSKPNVDPNKNKSALEILKSISG